MSNAESTVQAIIDGSDAVPDLDSLKKYTKELKAEQEFGIARQLLEKATANYPDDPWLIQQKALCTYKDAELPTKNRLLEALELLESIGLRDQKNNNSETLALGGAVYKRLWEHSGQMENLLQSLAFYRAAHDRDRENDLGYGGNNAAFILDLLAARTASVSHNSPAILQQAEQLRQDAKEIREQVRDQLLETSNKDKKLAAQYWFIVTLAEAYFGVRPLISKAGTQLKKATVAVEWELQTTFRQLVMLLRNQGISTT